MENDAIAIGADERLGDAMRETGKEFTSFPCAQVLLVFEVKDEARRSHAMWRMGPRTRPK